MVKRKLSILIFSLDAGGAERVVSILAEELSSSFDISLVLMSKKIFYLVPDHIDIQYLDDTEVTENGLIKLLKLPYLALKYKNICKTNNIDISMSFMNRPNYINILSRAFGNDAKILINERAMPSLQHQYGLQGRINRFLIKRLYNYADLVIANSSGNCQDLKNNFGISKVQTINNPFDLDKIESLSVEQVNFDYRCFTFVTVGRLDYGKNHKLLIKAFSRIKDAQLIIIGDGNLKKDLESQIQNDNLSNRVFLLGKQTNVYKFLSKADCFVFSSLYEGFPNVIVEALACKLPVISTDCKSGPREILSPNTKMDNNIEDIEVCEYGVLCEVDSVDSLYKAMLLMQNNQLLRVKYKETVLTRAMHFKKEDISKKYEQVINELI